MLSSSPFEFISWVVAVPHPLLGQTCLVSLEQCLFVHVSAVRCSPAHLPNVFSMYRVTCSSFRWCHESALVSLVARPPVPWGFSFLSLVVLPLSSVHVHESSLAVKCFDAEGIKSSRVCVWALSGMGESAGPIYIYIYLYIYIHLHLFWA